MGATISLMANGWPKFIFHVIQILIMHLSLQSVTRKNQQRLGSSSKIAYFYRGKGSFENYTWRPMANLK